MRLKREISAGCHTSKQRKKMTDALLLVYPQVDIGDGSEEAWTLLSREITSRLEKCSDLFVALLSRQFNHPCHDMFWTDRKGSKPKVGTIVPIGRFVDSEWYAPNSALCTRFRWSTNKETVTIEKPKCLTGTPGHCVNEQIMFAIAKWECERPSRRVHYYFLDEVDPQWSTYVREVRVALSKCQGDIFAGGLPCDEVDYTLSAIGEKLEHKLRIIRADATRSQTLTFREWERERQKRGRRDPNAPFFGLPLPRGRQSGQMTRAEEAGASRQIAGLNLGSDTGQRRVSGSHSNDGGDQGGIMGSIFTGASGGPPLFGPYIGGRSGAG